MFVCTRKKAQVIRVFIPPSDTEQIVEWTLIDLKKKRVTVGVETAERNKILRGEVEDREEAA